MNSFEKNARIVCRMKSVDVTRVIPSRCAASVASVDLPVPVRAADEEHDRRVELLKRLQAAQPAHRPARVGLAEHLDRELAEPVEVETRRARAPGGRLGAAGQLVGPRQRQPVAGSARAIRPFENGGQSSPPSGNRSKISPLAHEATASAASRRSSASRSGSPDSGTTSFAASTTSTPRASAVLGDHVDRGGLQLDEQDVGVDPLQLRARAPPVGQAAGDVHDLGAVLVSRCGAMHAVRLAGAVPKKATRRPVDRLGRARPEHRRDDRHVAARRPRPPHGRASLPELLPRPSSARRDRPTGAGSRSGSRQRPRDPGARPTTSTRRRDGDGWQRGAAAVEDDEVRVQRRRPAAPPHARSRSRPHPRARRRSGDSRPSRHPRAQRSRGGRTPHGVRRATARRARRPSAARARLPARAALPAPSRRRRRCRSRRRAAGRRGR